MPDAFLHKAPVRLYDLKCPVCLSSVEGATVLNLEDRPVTPKAGSVTICLFCGAVNEFIESAASRCGLALRVASEQSIEAVRRNPRFRRIFDAALAAASELTAKQRRPQ